MTEVYSKPNDGIPFFLRRGALGKEFHAFAYKLFPAMTESEFDGLVESIQTNGFYAHEPISLHEGKILDGRNRALACEVAGVVPVYTDLPEGIDPLQFVIAKNLHRRHLDESQRAMVAANLATMKRGDNQHASIEATSQSEAAELLRVSRASVQRAVEVRDRGVPELQQAVEQGEVSVSTAAAVVKLSKPEQRKAVAGGKAAVRKAAKRVAPAGKPTIKEAMKMAGDVALLRRAFPSTKVAAEPQVTTTTAPIIEPAEQEATVEAEVADRMPMVGVRFNDSDEDIGRFIEALGHDRFFRTLQHAPELKVALEARFASPHAQARLAGQKEQAATRLTAAKAGIAARAASPPVPDEPISPVHASKILLAKYH